MKDAQGHWRGRCTNAGCQCNCFMSDDAACLACDYCEHSPSDHVVLGPCTSCLPNECDEYVEDAGEEGKCSYCGCTPDDHELQCKLPGCTKPRWVEGERIHEYCGRSHARQYLIQEEGAETVCKFPNCLRPRYQEPSGRIHDFCGRTHAQQYNSMMQRGMLPTASTPVAMATSGSRGGGGGGGPHCKFPGCQKPCYREPSGRAHEFCGRTHAQIYMAMPQGGALPRPTTATMLTRDSAAHLVMEDNNEIVQAFLKTWTKNPEQKPKPADIKGVFRIDNPTLKSRFEQYCARLTSSNVSWHYHGTSIKCHLLQSKTLCSDPSCGICGISGVGFDKARIGTHVNWFQRFGKAFCLAPNSSKCHEYTLGFGAVRALLYCQVALGNPHYTTCDMPTCHSPPLGYDSVYGRAGTHRSNKGTLNYDEVAIYGVSEAILPRYIIVYQKDGINGLLR